jgi:uncharacterized membrane protein/heme/copper-type cytochrome/quinol oxidase subunit 2
MSTAKRVYFYLVYFIALGMFSAGVGMLLHLCFELITQYPAIQIGAQTFARETLSLGLAMLVIGGVLWFLFWRAIQRNVARDPVEIGSAIRKFFMNLILAVSALVVLNTAASFLVWLMDGALLDQFPSGALATLLVNGVIWYYHWQLTEKEGQPSPVAKTLRRWYVYLLSAWGLIALSISVGVLVSTAVMHLPVWGETIVPGRFWDSGVQGSLAWILIGGAAWGFHWFRMARGDADSTLRQVYLYLLAISGGAIAGLVALTTSLFKVFRFGLGNLSLPTDASLYFQFLGWTVPTMLVAAAIWVYHHRVTQEEAVRARQRLSARRVHSYLMSFIGLGTLIAGLIILLGILLDVPLRAASIAVTPGWWQNQLSVCLALLVVATPIWLYYWKGALQMAAKGVAERRARSRRIFLYIVVGAAIVTLAADLINIIYQLLDGLLQGKFGLEVLRHSKWSLQTLVVAVPVLMYHWRILRQDQRLGAEAKAARKTVTVLVSDRAADLASRIERKLGYKVHTLQYLGQKPKRFPAPSDKEISRLVANIKAAPGTKVMLIATGGRILVLPYQEK